MGSYAEAFAGLNEAQKKAVTTIDGPVLVIAGPGTGKTQLLTTRIAHILSTTDTLPQNILCLTFTESAAYTMRERLANMIGQGAYDVTISTYHAFGSDLISRFPEYFTEGAELEPIDDLGINSLFRSIIADLPYSNPLKHSDMYLRDMQSLISDAKRALLTPDDIRAIAKHNSTFIQAVSPIVSKLLGSIIRLTKKDIPNFVALAESVQAHLSTGHPVDNTKLPEQITPLSVLFTQELVEAVALAEETGKATPLTKWKNNWLAKDGQGLFIVDGLKHNQKLSAVADIYDAYLQLLQKNKLFDYDDMILRAVRALETHDDLRFSLQEQYLYILLDEFQDTNGAQLKIVELLTNNPASEGRPNVLAVGDDDQAIYAFQGANYSHMLQFKEMYLDVLPIALTQNYRSHHDILQTARGVAEQIEERLHHHFPEIEKTLTAAGTNLPKHAVVERREAASDVMQFAWVTKRIAELIKSGIPASEIAVLAPQHRYLQPLVSFLQQASVPIRYDKRENILEDPAVTQLVRMAELCIALASPEQNTTANALWSEVLSFAFWQLPTSTIWRLSLQSADDQQTWTDSLLQDEALKPIALFFVRASQVIKTETLETMLDYLIGSATLDLQEPGQASFTSPYYDYYFGSQSHVHFWELLTNLIVLRGRLRDYKRAGDERLTLHDFIGFVAAHQAAEIKILNTSPYATGDDAVQLMTAFKSKGMEFSVVFVLAVNEEAWGTKARGAGNRISLPQNMQFIRYAGATNDERLRLFYVAITRAKTQLYLVNYSANYTGKAMTHLKYLNETTDDRYVLQSPLLPEGKQAVQKAEEVIVQPTTELNAYWQQRHEQALTEDGLRTLLQSRLERFQISPTHVNDFVDVVYGGPQSFFLRTILRFPQAPLPQVQFGNAIHETLEWIHKSTKQHNDGTIPGEPSIITYFEERLRAKRLSERSTEQFIERGTAALHAYCQNRLQTVHPTDVVEYNFRNEGVFIGKAHLAGKIDKLIIDRKQKTITIVDFKTGKSHNKWSREAKLHKYKQQLYIYRALVEGSHTYAGYTVTDAYLEFVEPDDDGVIQELHVTFTDQEYKRIKRLVEVVWQHIQNIDLPDTTNYSADLAGIEAFEEDLLQQTQ